MIDWILINNTIGGIYKYLQKPFWEEYGFYTGLLNLIVLSVTLWYLRKYTIETKITREQISRQTELEQMPIMLLFIRNVTDGVPFGEQIKLRDKLINFLIKIGNDQPDFYFSLRNTGKGTAFNVVVESDKFEISEYKTQFFAPQKDEHPIKIIYKGDKQIENLEDFNNSIFIINCKDLTNNEYQFKYKIVDLVKRKVDFIEIIKIF